ncbi:MAG TPA: V-type ATP synthase subunit F [Lachnospiraceae bacterium]|nr:V-type ATP synthase subunit F [Lachnospiraceae bacterium]
MYKVGVMGDYDSIYGFAAVGLTIFPTDGLSDEEIARLIRQTSEGCGIIYMTESLMERMKNELQKYQDRISPAIIAIPGVSKNTGIGIRNVKKSVEQAVGSDILFENK